MCSFAPVVCSVCKSQVSRSLGENLVGRKSDRLMMALEMR